jgi:hypothetical protein
LSSIMKGIFHVFNPCARPFTPVSEKQTVPSPNGTFLFAHAAVVIGGVHAA